MKFVKLLLFFGLLGSMQSQAGIISWLSKNDNTISAAVPAGVAGFLTSAALNLSRDPKAFNIFHFGKAKSFDRLEVGAGLLVAATTFAAIKWYLGKDKKPESK
jgi:hypothetical protein